MKYALIGCGRIAVNHIRAAINNHLQIVAVCDIKPEAMEMLLEKFGLETDSSIKRYTDYQTMLTENEVELAAIATESGLHAQIALHCMDHNVPVIIEKPIAMSISDAEKIIRKSEEKKVKVCACHQNRFNIAVQETRRALEVGRFGRLSHGSVHVRWNRNQNYYVQAPWRGTWAQDGGCLMNQCIHGIDLLRWMMGDEVEEVYGVTRRQFHDYLECEDVGMAVVKFKNGAIGTIEGTTNVYPQNLEETLDFTSTPFDYASADYLEPMVDFYKISSSDLTNLPFIKHIGKKGKPVFLSTGAAYLSEIDEAVRVLREAGCQDLVLLHCVLSYPTKPEDANLRMIETLKRVFPDMRVGFSDHVVPDEAMTTLSTAYLLGAEVLEKHFTLDKKLPGNDHYHAGDPRDFQKAITNFRKINTLLGNGEKTVLDCERVSRREARRSLVLTRDMRAGEVIREIDVMAKRPGTGISPKYMDVVIGKQIKIDLGEDSVLTWDFL